MAKNKIPQKVLQLLTEELELDEKDLKYIEEALRTFNVRPDYAEVYLEIRGAACERSGDACDASTLLTVREAVALALRLIDAAAKALETEREIVRAAPP